MSLNINSNTETNAFAVHEVDLDSSVVNYNFIPKPDLKTILEAQLKRNTLAQRRIRPLPTNIEMVNFDLYKSNEQLKSQQFISLSAATLLENAIIRARNSIESN
jgi:hypothetical protein